MTEPKEVTEFKKSLAFEARKKKADLLLQKYPNRMPVIILQQFKSKLPPLSQYKFLLEQSITIQNVSNIVRQNLKLEAKQSLFLTVNNKIPVGQAEISIIYFENKDEDGFLYLIYAAEDSFGAD